MANDEVLTDAESEAILEQPESQDATPVEGVQEPGSEFWEKVSTDRIPALEGMNAGLADALVESWQDLFSRRIVVSPQAPRYTDGRRLAQAIEFEQSVKSFDLQPIGEQGLLIVQPDTVSAMVDICFGGPGSGGRSERLAALTGMERRLFVRFCDRIHDSLKSVWGAHSDMQLEDSEQPFDVSMHSLCEPGAHSVVCRFLFDVGQEQHHLDFVWPQEMINRLNAMAPRALPSAKQNDGPNWPDRISEDVKAARIEVRAVIGDISVRLHEISTAKTGDIIMTEQLDKVCLIAGSQPVFVGTLGSHEGNNAVKISKPYVRNRAGEF